MPPASPVIRQARRWNIVWVVPIVALFLGAWLLYQNFATQGTVALVRFETANSITSGTTEVRCRSVRVGVVKDVKLADDLKSVLVYIEIDADSEHLLRRGTRFWVVKPRLSVTEFSGAETLITGAYMELDPGPPEAERWTSFEGRESPPSTNSTVPGRRLVLATEQAGSLAVGAPIYFRGLEVGRIESRELTEDTMRIVYNAFISEKYSNLVTTNTRFWNTSGIDISAGADGFKVRTPSFQAMVSGGVSFGVTTGEPPGEPVADGMEFRLFRDEDAARKATFNPTQKYILLFDQTIRGLAETAPVEFRGITIGRVTQISFDLIPTADDPRIPVLIEIDPCLMRPDAARAQETADRKFIREAVAKGLRASLKTGSLITGALYVDLDYYADAAPAEMVREGEHLSIPTVSSGFAQLEAKITSILDKLEKLPLDETMTEITAAAKEAQTTIAEARGTLTEIEATATAARKTLDQLEKTTASVGPNGAIQGDLMLTLDELRAALRSFKSVATTIDEKPNSLLFGRESSGNPKPKAAR